MQYSQNKVTVHMSKKSKTLKTIEALRRISERMDTVIQNNTTINDDDVTALKITGLSLSASESAECTFSSSIVGSIDVDMMSVSLSQLAKFMGATVEDINRFVKSMKYVSVITEDEPLMEKK
jgi:uncharacterized lipoprotein YehR (DUF1307 family)